MDWFSVDRIEGELVVLEAADGSTKAVPLSRFSTEVHEGDIVTPTADGFAADPDETARRRAAILALQNKLFSS